VIRTLAGWRIDMLANPDAGSALATSTADEDEAHRTDACRFARNTAFVSRFPAVPS